MITLITWIFIGMASLGCVVIAIDVFCLMSEIHNYFKQNQKTIFDQEKQ